MAIRARYKGDGSEFYVGIPARSLDEDEYQALDADQRALLRASPLYDVKTDAEMHPSSSTTTASTERKDDGAKS